MSSPDNLRQPFFKELIALPNTIISDEWPHESAKGFAEQTIGRLRFYANTVIEGALLTLAMGAGAYLTYKGLSFTGLSHNESLPYLASVVGGLASGGAAYLEGKRRIMGTMLKPLIS